MFLAMLKSKSTPIRSKKLSLSVMKRTSIVTCKSCIRRNCSRRSTISSWTSCVWLTTRLKLVGEAAILPLPPLWSQVGGRHGLRDQVDQRVEIGGGAAAGAAGPAAGAGLRAAGQAGRDVGHHRRVDRRRRSAGRRCWPPRPSASSSCRSRRWCPPRCPWRRATRRPVPSAGWRRSSESASPGRPPGRPAGRRWSPFLRLAGDVQHLVLDDVAEVMLLQDQVEIALQLDVAGQFQRDGRIGR